MNKVTLLAIVFIFPFFVLAQEEKEDIGTQEVTVIKSYTPSLQDVFKLRNSPETLDSIVAPKKAVEYSIFSVPVASTFIPSKGTARKLILEGVWALEISINYYLSTILILTLTVVKKLIGYCNITVF